MLETMVIVLSPCSLTRRHKINDFVDWRYLKHVCREAGKCYVARSKLVATLLSGVSSVQFREGSRAAQDDEVISRERQNKLACLESD